MIRALTAAIVVAITVTTGFHTSAQAPATSIQMAGLTQPVEILRDRWGINHIYAQNEADLFSPGMRRPGSVFQFECGGGSDRHGRGNSRPTGAERERGVRLHHSRRPDDASSLSPG